MFFSSKLTRTRALTLFVLAAAIYSAFFASPFSNPAHAAGDETVQVFAGDCKTPQNIFYLGDTVCVRVGDFPLHPTVAEYYRRINWSAPGLGVAETELVGADPEYDRFTIPSSGPFALPGRWRVQTVDIETNTRADGHFVVRHPRLLLADLHLWKAGPDFVLPGDKLRYTLTIRNSGPELAETVQFAEDTPSNATFLAFRQRSGSPFECQLPKSGEAGRILCTSKVMRLDEEATFDIYYVVSDNAREGDTCDGRTQVASLTEELHKYDNLVRSSTPVSAPAGEEPPPTEEQENPTGGDPPKDVPEPEIENPPGIPPGPTPRPEPENPPGIPPPPDLPKPEEENPPL
jgi:uncharacterized repeat protein (TIGR01451 family)